MITKCRFLRPHAPLGELFAGLVCGCALSWYVVVRGLASSMVGSSLSLQPVMVTQMIGMSTHMYVCA